MSNAARRPMTVDEFLHWEEQQTGRWEFDGFAPRAMVGGTGEHSQISGNIYAKLLDKLRGSPCRVYGSDAKIRVAGRIRYPDAFVACTPVPRGTTVFTEPVVVFEVLSEGTSRVDRTDKLMEYRDTPSVQRYILLEQDRVAATVWSRGPAGWTGQFLHADAALSMPEIGAEVPLAAFYDSVDLPPPEPEA